MKPKWQLAKMVIPENYPDSWDGFSYMVGKFVWVETKKARVRKTLDVHNRPGEEHCVRTNLQGWTPARKLVFLATDQVELQPIFADRKIRRIPFEEWSKSDWLGIPKPQQEVKEEKTTNDLDFLLEAMKKHS